MNELLHRNEKRLRSAFTLIELLVVISIIALLIGILLPALGSARNSARVIASSSNQRQMGIAMAAYRTDNKGFFPLWQQGNGAVNNPEWFWTTKLAVDGYLPSLDVYIDPAFDGAYTGFATIEQVDRTTQDNRLFNLIHYGYNYVHVGANLHQPSTATGGVRQPGSVEAFNPRAGAPIDQPARIDDMEDPTTVLVTTGVRDYTENDPSFRGGPAPNEAHGNHVVLDINLDTIGNTGVPHARYNDALQIMWADGHVSALNVPFTQEEQDEAANGSQSAYRLVYGANALGDPMQFGGATRGGGTNNGPNYFDIVASRPNN